MNIFENIVDRLKRQVFETVVKNNLVYNTCWEDPAVDRELLEIDASSRVITITSAGCNALDYLLDQPKKLHCVDINPAQNALLELKRALFIRNDYPLLWQMFGEGRYTGASAQYHQKLRGSMTSSSRAFWDRHIDYFSPHTTRKSF